MNYPKWRVTVNVANQAGIDQVTVEIDAPDAWAAEEDVTSMLYHGDGWEILSVDSVAEVGQPA